MICKEACIGVLLNGLNVAQLLQFLHPIGQLVQFSDNPIRFSLQVILKLGLAILDDFRVLLKDRPNPVGPRERSRVERNVLRGKDVHVDQVEKVLFRVVNVLLMMQRTNNVIAFTD